jgi:WD40 repeat protein
MHLSLCNKVVFVIFYFILMGFPLQAADTLHIPAGEIGYGDLGGLQVTKNEKYLITRARPGKVRIWSVETAQVVATIAATSDSDFFVTSDIFPGDSLLVTGTYYGKISIWHIPDGALRTSFSFPNRYGGFGSITVSPDGTRMLVYKDRYLAMIRTDGSVDTSFKSQEYVFDIAPVIFTPDGSNFAAVYNSSLNIYNAASGGIVRKFYFTNPATGKPLPIALYDISPDGSQVLSRYEQGNTWGSVSIYVGCLNIASGGLGTVLKAPGNPVDSKFFPDGSKIVSCTIEGPIYISDAVTGDTIRSFRPKTSQKLHALSGNGSHFLTTDNNDDIFLLDAGTGQQVATFKGHSSISGVDISPDGATAISTAGAKIWDIASRQYTGSLQDTGGIQCAVFTPDGTGIVTCSNRGAIALWDLKSRTLSKMYFQNNQASYTVAISPEGNRIAAAHSNTVRIWDKSTGDSITFFNLPLTSYAIKFSPDGTHIAAGYGDSLLLWNIANRNVKWKRSAGASVRSISFSPDGTMLVAGAIYRDAVVYATENGDSLMGIAGGGYSVAWSHNGRYIAGSNFSNGHLYDVQGKTFVQWYQTNTSNIGSGSCATAFAPDDSKLFTAIGGNIQIWDNTRYTITLHRSISSRNSAMVLSSSPGNIIRLALNGHHTLSSLTLRLYLLNGKVLQLINVPGTKLSGEYITLKPKGTLAAGLYYYIIREQNQVLGSGRILLYR